MNRRQLGRVLVAALGGPQDLDAALSSAADDLGDLPALAAEHKVSGAVYAALRMHDRAPADVVAALAERYEAAVAGHMRTLGDLAHVDRILSGAGIPFLVVKGPVLAERSYGDPGLRSYSDLDLLVAPDAFSAALDALVEAGCPLLDRNWALIRREHRGQLHLELTFGSPADLHWHLLVRQQEALGVRTGELLQRGRRVPVGPVEVGTLDREDALLHLCVHAAYSGGDRLVWLKDIERTLAADPPDWGVLVSRAAEWRAGAASAVLLARTRRVLGTEIPDAALRQLAGRVLRATSALADRVAPPERSTGGPSPARTFSRGAAQGLAGAVRDIRRRLGIRVRVAPEAGASQPVLVEAGTAEDKAAYLRAVSEAE